MLLLAPAAAGKAESPLDPDTPVVMPLERYVGRLRQIQVGGAPPFLFDTGGGLTVVTPRVAEAWGCEPHGVTTGFRHDGSRIDFPECGVLSFPLPGMELRVFTGVFDLGALLPADLPELGGVLSLHTFRGRKVTLRLAENRLVVESAGSFARGVRDMDELHARLDRSPAGEGLDLFVEAGAQRGTLWLLVDSGNLDPVLLAPHALRQLGLDAWAEAEERGEEPEPRAVTLDLLGHGPVEVTARAKAGMIHDGLLNAETLERLVLAMDLDSGRAWIRAAD